MAKRKSRKKVTKQKPMIDKKRWAITGGLWWGLAILALGLIATYLSWGVTLVNVLGSLYIGYNATLAGTLIGTAWAVVDMFIGVWILLWIYEWVGKLSA